MVMSFGSWPIARTSHHTTDKEHISPRTDSFCSALPLDLRCGTHYRRVSRSRVETSAAKTWLQLTLFFPFSTGRTTWLCVCRLSLIPRRSPLGSLVFKAHYAGQERSKTAISMISFDEAISSTHRDVTHSPTPSKVMTAVLTRH
jgi:hypothetical protein